MNIGTEKILALIPAYNEEKHIARVVEQACAYLPVVVVDDGSRDRTAEYAEAAGAYVIRQHPNQGKGEALRTGFHYALEVGAQAVVMLDADGQHDPQEIPLFLQVYHQKWADLVIGLRDFSKMPLVRRTTNTIGRYLFSWAAGKYIPDNQSGYRLVSNRLMEAMLDSREGGFEFEVDMIVVCLQRGYQLDWVPIRTIYADEKSHIQPLRHVYHYFRLVWQTRRRLKH
ncbi:MAG: glycosyltransferase family 2 protein [Anaerolineales bacterium]